MLGHGHGKYFVIISAHVLFSFHFPPAPGAEHIISIPSCRERTIAATGMNTQESFSFAKKLYQYSRIGSKLILPGQKTLHSA